MSERDQLLQPAEQSKTGPNTKEEGHERLFTLGYPSAKEDGALKGLQAPALSHPGDSGSPELDRLLEAASKAKGQELWRGELPEQLSGASGAVAVRKVLQQGGLDVQDTSKSVRELTDSLINKSGWTKDADLNHAHPGDLLVTQQDAHGWISMVGDHSFYGNSLKGTWQETAQVRQHPGETFLLNQPEKH